MPLCQIVKVLDISILNRLFSLSGNIVGQPFSSSIQPYTHLSLQWSDSNVAFASRLTSDFHFEKLNTPTYSGSEIRHAFICVCQYRQLLRLPRSSVIVYQASVWEFTVRCIAHPLVRFCARESVSPLPNSLRSRRKVFSSLVYELGSFAPTLVW